MRRQIRFNNAQEKELDLLMAKTRVKNQSEAIHIGVQYALKYFDLVTKALETNDFELALLRKTKYYRKKGNKESVDFS